MSNTTASVGQTLGQPRALAVSSGRPSGSVKSTAGSSSGAQKCTTTSAYSDSYLFHGCR